MTKKFYTLTLSLALLFTLAFASATARTTATEAARVGDAVADFTLPDADGKQHKLSTLRGAKGTALIFISVQCPVSNAYNERMAQIAADYKAKGINVVGINSNVAEMPDAIKTHAKEKNLAFPILKDKGNKIADLMNAQFTPEVFLLDANNKLVYHGRIDNARNGGEITAPDLRNAMDAVVAGKAVATPETKAFGCSIKRA
jgi:peroxiredoxin